VIRAFEMTMKTFVLIEHVISIFSNILLAISIVCLIFMMGHVVLDVFMKITFNSPIIGTLETVSYYYMVGAVFLPLAVVELKKENVHVDLFIQFAPIPVRRALIIFGNIICALYFGGLCYQTLIDAVESFQYKETIMSNYLFYVWPSRWALPIGFLAVVLVFVSSTLRQLQEFQSPPTKDED
tara:strand:- start:536 stop:1081 length:546 start_codon:yes stop_codon:yes gene_type:complete